jgi:phosphoribosylaminoimidazolecarboxamide formyltransferase / IMP cyclohydrolase
MPIRRALLSVSDKTGLIDFARALVARDVKLLSTGGTFKALSDAGIAVQAVDNDTASPEVRDGRVKTLHPRIHGGLLAREGIDEADLQRIGAEFIDLVIVNLYPFEQTLERPGSTYEELVENIDIGGPSMLRSAAKNHARVTVVCDPADYALVKAELEAEGNSVSLATRQRLAAKVYAHTAAYDGMIATWLSAQGESDGHPRSRVVALEKCYGLRYGENPHQTGAFYRERRAPEGSLARAQSLGAGAKELSFNNLVDAEAALDAVRDFDGPAAVVIKHASPCGLATAPALHTAYKAAREADAMSAFGGIVALNRNIDLETANVIGETFIECVIAPGYEPAALEQLQKKKALRILATGSMGSRDDAAWQYKRVSGGFALQSRDATGPGEVRKGTVATTRAPSAEELEALEFAWVACKHVKSNAIVLAKASPDGGYATVGVGGGQTARVLAVKVATENAGENAKGSVLARAGVTAIAQPGGSKQDEEVIRAANAAGIAMIFTSVRHFRH